MGSAAVLASVLPCVGQQAVYDALFDDVPAATRAAAQATALTLCSRCPLPCPDQVTAASAPRAVEILYDDWMPGETDGRPQYDGTERWHGTASGVTVHGCSCHRCQTAHDAGRARRQEAAAARSIRVGGEYVKPSQRPARWAAMAADLEQRGRTLAQIALELCVSEDTVRALLALPGRRRA